MARLAVKLLGGFQANLNEVPITGFKSGKVRALLAFLIVESNKPHSRDYLAWLLWPDSSNQAALTNLRSDIANLRKILDDNNNLTPHLLINRETIQFNLLSDYSLDVAAFTSLPADLDSKTSRLEQLEQATYLCQGAFLSGFSVSDSAPFEEWVLLKREQIDRQVTGVLNRLVTAYEQNNEYEKAEVFARKLVELEPWNEEAHQQLMYNLVVNGKRSAALAQYEACCRLLEKELDVSPSQETIALYQAIRDGTLKKPSTLLNRELPAPGIRPYKGLQYFDEQDADLFFGRELLSAKLVAHIRDILDTTHLLEDKTRKIHFLAVVGASGSGKSSVVRAGLVPAIRRGQLLPDGTLPPTGSPDWNICILTPTDHPLQALALSVAQKEQSVIAVSTLMDDLKHDKRSLNIYVSKSLIPKRDGRLLLIVDQFEELFTQCRDEVERISFIDNLLTAAANGGPALVVIVLRADFYTHCARYPALRQALCDRQEYIGPMLREELQRAIEEPARKGNWEIEEGLVDLILRDSGDEPGTLPLLSHALSETWERRRGRTLTLQGYQNAGEVHGAIACTANTVFSRLKPEQQEIARHIFLRLTEMGEGSLDSRRRASLEELISSSDEAKPVQDVLRMLADARLITLSANTAEIAHEALIREWPVLREWLDQDREGLHLLRHLTESAIAWENLNRDSGELYRGARLAQVLEWYSQSCNLAMLNKLEQEFLIASQEFAEQEAQAREVQLQHELEIAQKLAEVERQKAEAESRRAKEQAHSASKLRRRALFLVAMLFVTLVMIVVAVFFGWRENRQATIATARELALAAQNTLSIDPELSILLGLKSASSWVSVGESIPYDLQATFHQAIPAARARFTWQAGEEAILSVSFIQPGDLPRVITGDRLNGLITVWDPISNQRLVTLPGSIRTGASGGSFPIIRLNPSGTLIAIPAEDATTKLWDAVSGQELCSFTGNSTEVRDAFFSPGGNLLITQELLGYMIWEVVSCQKLLEIPALGNFSKASDISQDGKYIAAVTQTKEISIFEIASGLKISTIPAGFDLTVLAFSPDGNFLVGAGRENYFVLWNVLTGNMITTFTSQIIREGQAEALAYTPDGNRVLLNTSLYDLKTSKEIISLLGHTKPVSGLAFNKDGSRVITASYDGTVKIWDLTTEHEVLTLSHPSGFIYGVAFSPDGKWLATSGEDQTTTIWEIATGRKLHVLSGHTDIINDAVFSPDGNLLATGSADQTVMVWDTRTWQVLHTLFGFGEDRTYVPYIRGVFNLSFSPACRSTSSTVDSCPLAAVGHDGHLIIWDAVTGQVQMTYQDPTAGLMSVAFSPDGKLLAIGNADMQGEDSWATILEVSSGGVLHTLPRARAWVWSLAFSPDGQRLATINFYGDGKVWDVESGEALVELKGVNDGGYSITYNPDGTLIAVGSSGYVALLDANTGQFLLPLQGHQSLVVRSAFSPDGKYLATASFDGTARIYAVPEDNLLSLARSRLTRSWTLEECQKYLHQNACP